MLFTKVYYWSIFSLQSPPFLSKITTKLIHLQTTSIFNKFGLIIFKSVARILIGLNLLCWKFLCRISDWTFIFFIFYFLFFYFLFFLDWTFKRFQSREATANACHQTLPAGIADMNKFLSSWGPPNILRFPHLPGSDLFIHPVRLLGTL